MHDRHDHKYIGVKVLAIIFGDFNKHVRLDEPLTERLSLAEKKELEVALSKEYGCGNIPRHVQTPEAIAGWISDCRYQEGHPHTSGELSARASFHAFLNTALPAAA